MLRMAPLATRRSKNLSNGPECSVCGHIHEQGVKCTICGHVGKGAVYRVSADKGPRHRGLNFLTLGPRAQRTKLSLRVSRLIAKWQVRDDKAAAAALESKPATPMRPAASPTAAAPSRSLLKLANGPPPIMRQAKR